MNTHTSVSMQCFVLPRYCHLFFHPMNCFELRDCFEVREDSSSCN